MKKQKYVNTAFPPQDEGCKMLLPTPVLWLKNAKKVKMLSKKASLFFLALWVQQM